MTLSQNQSQLKALNLLDQESEIPDKNRFRLIIVGSCRVGKTALIHRFINNYFDFDGKYVPTVEDFYKKLYLIKDLPCVHCFNEYPHKMLGRDVFARNIRHFRNQSFSGHATSLSVGRFNVKILDAFKRDLYLVVFSVDSQDSFQQAQVYRQAILEARGSKSGRSKIATHTPMVLVGNKCDLVDYTQVRKAEINAYLKTQSNLPYVEGSAKTSRGIETVCQLKACLEVF